MAAPTLTTGASVTFSSGFLAQILTMSHTGIERTEIESTHFGTTGARTYVPGSLYNPGSLECTIKFDASTLPPVAGAVESVTIDYPGSTNNWTADGFLSTFEVTGELEGHYEATARIKLSGTIAVA